MWVVWGIKDSKEQFLIQINALRVQRVRVQSCTPLPIPQAKTASWISNSCIWRLHGQPPMQHRMGQGLVMQSAIATTFAALELTDCWEYGLFGCVLTGDENFTKDW